MAHLRPTCAHVRFSLWAPQPNTSTPKQRIPKCTDTQPFVTATACDAQKQTHLIQPSGSPIKSLPCATIGQAVCWREHKLASSPLVH
eukprot:45787-Amphidinium_carterae.1